MSEPDIEEFEPSVTIDHLDFDHLNHQHQQLLYTVPVENDNSVSEVPPPPDVSV
jgi:hypothetical protein